MMKENPHIKPKPILIGFPRLIVRWLMYSFGTPRKGRSDSPYNMPRELSAFFFTLFVVALGATLIFTPIVLAIFILVLAAYDLIRSMVYAYYPAYYEDNSDA